MPYLLLMHAPGMLVVADRARDHSLAAYGEALRESQSSEVEAIYEAIITAYPACGVCNKLGLARYGLPHELEAQRGGAMSHADTRTVIAALTETRDV